MPAMLLFILLCLSRKSRNTFSLECLFHSVIPGSRPLQRSLNERFVALSVVVRVHDSRRKGLTYQNYHVAEHVSIYMHILNNFEKIVRPSCQLVESVRELSYSHIYLPSSFYHAM